MLIEVFNPPRYCEDDQPVTPMTLVADSSNVTGFAEWSPMVTVDARAVDIEQRGAGAAAEVFGMPGLLQGSDTLLTQCFNSAVYLDRQA